MAWYRIYKTYRGGKSDIGFIEVPYGSNKEIVEDYAREWAERQPGGYCYGWTVYWTRAKRPSKIWLETKLKELKYKKEYINQQIDRYLKLI